MLKTLGKTTWDKIEVGEVFAYNGCWVIGCKITKSHWIALANNFSDYLDVSGRMLPWCANLFYKLPKSIQKLWKEE